MKNLSNQLLGIWCLAGSLGIVACGDVNLNNPSAPAGTKPLASIIDAATKAAATNTTTASKSKELARYEVSVAVEDKYSYAAYPDAHGVYINRTTGKPLDLGFVEKGLFIEYADGTAKMTGLMADKNDATVQFKLEVNFTDRASSTSTPIPHTELRPEAYKANGGPVDPSTWVYYKLNGHLTGLGNYSDVDVELTKTHQVDYQVGVGANGKNAYFGASVWFYCAVRSGQNKINLPAEGDCNGDINVNLTKVPTPKPTCDAGYTYDEKSNECVKNPEPTPECKEYPNGYYSPAKDKCVYPTPEPEPKPECKKYPNGYYSPAKDKCVYPTPKPDETPTCKKGYTKVKKQCVKNPEPVKPTKPKPPVVVIVPVPVILVPIPVYYYPPVVVRQPVYYPPCGCHNYTVW